MLHLILTLLASQAQAAVPTVNCISFEEINGAVDTCEGNGHYGEAGISCAKQFEKLIKEQSELAKKSLSASNQAKVDKAGNNQTHNFSGAAADYAISMATLEGLIAAGQQAKRNVDSYLENIVFPEDFDAPEEAIGDPIEFLDKNACYAENRDGLEKLLDTIDDQLEDLEKAKQASLARHGTSSTRQEGMQNSLVNGASNTKAVGSKAAVPKGTSQNGKSDITGVKEDKQKRSK